MFTRTIKWIKELLIEIEDESVQKRRKHRFLNKKDIVNIETLIEAGASRAYVSEQLDISYSTVSRVARGLHPIQKNNNE